MLELYEVTLNGKFMGQCHADSWDDAVATMMERLQYPLLQSFDGWEAEIVQSEPQKHDGYISPSVDGY